MSDDTPPHIISGVQNSATGFPPPHCRWRRTGQLMPRWPCGGGTGRGMLGLAGLLGRLRQVSIGVEGVEAQGSQARHQCLFKYAGLCVLPILLDPTCFSPELTNCTKYCSLISEGEGGEAEAGLAQGNPVGTSRWRHLPLKGATLFSHILLHLIPPDPDRGVPPPPHTYGLPRPSLPPAPKQRQGTGHATRSHAGGRGGGPYLAHDLRWRLQ